jgi:hypothetical protein
MMSDRLPNRANRGVDLGVFVLATLPQKERAPRPATQPVLGFSYSGASGAARGSPTGTTRLLGVYTSTRGAAAVDMLSRSGCTIRQRSGRRALFVAGANAESISKAR